MKILVSNKLSNHKYVDNHGYLICQDCVLSRTGKQEYYGCELGVSNVNDNDLINVNRTSKEVFDEKTMASFENCPLTIDHPTCDVDSDNWNNLSVGFVRNIRKAKFKNQDVMIGDIVVTNEDAINKIKSGEMKELSCGYDCEITQDNKGNYQQTNIRGNHIALCEEGRAGIAMIRDSKKRKYYDSNEDDMTLLFDKKGIIYSKEKVTRFICDDRNEFWKAVSILGEKLNSNEFLANENDYSIIVFE